MKFIRYDKPLRTHIELYGDNKDNPTDLVLYGYQVPDGYVRLDRIPIIEMEVQVLPTRLVDVDTGKLYAITRPGLAKLLNMVASNEVTITENRTFRANFILSFQSRVLGVRPLDM